MKPNNMKQFLFTAILLTIGIVGNSQPTYFKQGSILHYGVTIIIDQDSVNTKKVTDFKIKIDTILHFQNGTSLILFSNYFDSIFEIHPINMKVLFFYQKNKIFKIYTESPLNFIKDFTKNYAYWNKQVKDSITSTESYKNVINNIYNFIPLIKITEIHSCDFYDSAAREIRDRDNDGTFACFKGNIQIKLFKNLENIKHYIGYSNKAVDEYYYSKKYGVIRYTSVAQIQAHFYEVDFRLFKI